MEAPVFMAAIAAATAANPGLIAGFIHDPYRFANAGSLLKFATQRAFWILLAMSTLTGGKPLAIGLIIPMLDDEALLFSLSLS